MATRQSVSVEKKVKQNRRTMNKLRHAFTDELVELAENQRNRAIVAGLALIDANSLVRQCFDEAYPPVMALVRRNAD